MIEEDNERLRRQLVELKVARAEVDKESRHKSESKDTTPRPPEKKEPRHIPGVASTRIDTWSKF